MKLQELFFRQSLEEKNIKVKDLSIYHEKATSRTMVLSILLSFTKRCITNNRDSHFFNKYTFNFFHFSTSLPLCITLVFFTTLCILI
jgi:hypothetical protein